MYYRLCDGFILRGWKQLSGVIIKRPYNQHKVLTQTQLSLLLLCDGKTDFSSIEKQLTEEQKKMMDRWTKNGIIERTEFPHPIDKDGEYSFYPNRFFESFFWSMTGRCNCCCRHCMMDAPDGSLGELSHEESIRLIDEMAECGALEISLTGGEPFVRDDFWELVDHICSKKIVVKQIYTNGILLTRSVLEKFIKRDMRPQICFSFDGIGWHDWMRGVKGAEEAVWRALELCGEMGFPIAIEMCLHKGNIPVLRETIKRLSEAGVTDIKIGNISPSPLWRRNSEGNELSHQSYIEAVLDYIPEFYQDGMPCNVMFTEMISMFRKSPKFQALLKERSCCKNPCNEFLCGAVRNDCYISPEGRVLPCMPMTESKNQDMFPRFQDEGLQKILTESEYMTLVDKRTGDLIRENEECRNCPYVLSCNGGCRARAFINTGNYMGIDEEVCFLWKNGYVDKIQEAAEAAVQKYCNAEEQK